MKPRVGILIPGPMYKRIFLERELERLSGFATIKTGEFSEIKTETAERVIAGADGCITSWGTCQLTKKILAAAPNLKIIVHAAGSVKPIVSETVWQKGIKVTSAAAAIAIGVAEHTLGLMLSAMKRNYWFNEIAHKGGWNEESEYRKVKEIFNITIGVVGFGHVGRHFVKLLRNFEVKILLYDPLISYEEARKSGAEKIEKIDDLMSCVDILSLHAPNLPETHHMINRQNLRLLKDGAILINTARGALINEQDLIKELKTGRITACLDVTDPEPPAPGNYLRRLPNVILTPHIAGTVANNMFRLGKLAVTELERFFSGRKLLYPVTKKDLARIA